MKEEKKREQQKSGRGKREEQKNERQKSEQQKSAGRNKYENFPLSLALFDALPVLFFCATVLVIGMKYKNTLFLTGSILCTLAGVGKVTWKIILAASKKDIAWMNRQMRFVMPLGFLLILVGTFTGGVRMAELWSKIISFPAGIFFGITVIGMVCMSIFAVKLDGTKVRSNWIEQITNAVAQGCLLLGVLLCR